MRFSPVGPLRPFGFVEIVAELAFQQPVGALHLLLLAQLQTVSGNLRAARLAVLAGNEIALLDRTLVRKAPQTFRNSFCASLRQRRQNCITMSCQLRFSLHKSVKKTFVSSNLPSTGTIYRAPYPEKIRRGGASADGSRCAESA